MVYEEWNSEMNKKEKESRFWIDEKRGRSLKSMRGDSESNNSYNRNAPKGGFAYKPDANEERDKSILQPYRIISHKLPRTIGINVNDLNMSGMPEGKTNKYQFTEVGKEICSQVEKWLRARNWYQERNIAWKRGILLVGKPGNGKSSLVLEIARKTGVPLYVFDLSSMDNGEFENALKDTCSDSAIILFEDFDNVFHGRNNITKTHNFGGLTFDMFINKLSGVNCIQNKFIFVTTNHLEKIDPAVLRPGRIDDVIEIYPLNKEEKLRMAEIILNQPVLIEQAMKDSEELSTAEFENKCVQLALDKYWSEEL